MKTKTKRKRKQMENSFTKPDYEFWCFSYIENVRNMSTKYFGKVPLGAEIG